MENLPTVQNGNINIKNREEIVVDGAENILSFEDYSLVIMTSLGKLTVEGEGMVIESLNNESGKIKIKGRISGIYYSEGKKGRGFFR
jgi:sporulation protein YabP